MNHKSLIIATMILALGAAWWVQMTPPEYLTVGQPIVFDQAVEVSAKAVDHSAQFAEGMETLPSDMPGHDDVLFLPASHKALASGMDGRIWQYDFDSKKAEVFVDSPLMAAGMHESPTKPDEVYFCASHLWGDKYPAGERVGLYRLHLSTRQIDPVVLDVPDTTINGPKVWADNDATAPHLGADGKGKSRPMAFCNDLEISADGQRIYFTEPFAYADASMGGGTVPEVIAYNGNGRIWRHDLITGETRLAVEGFHFPDGILYDLHPGQTREQSILSSQTAGFRISRFYLAGPKAGTSELVQDGLPGMCDGMDRDSKGRIWCGVYAPRSKALTWVHEHPALKHVLLRLPLNWISQPKLTGVLVLSPDAAKPLYSAWYEGPKAIHIASAIPAPDGKIYLTPFSKTHRGLVRMANPLD